MADEKISFAELEAKLRDIDISDEELQQYFVGNADHAGPFRPGLRVDDTLVEVSETDEPRVEAGIVGGFINNVERWRRRRRFRRNVDREPHKTILVSEGDSWFQFPFFLKDVIDQLRSSYHIWSSGAAGDTLQNMIFENPEYLDSLDADEVDGRAKGFLFSGGGNDILGENADGDEVLELMVTTFDASKSPAGHLVERQVKEQFAFIDKSYRRMIQDINANFDNVQMFIHGYGYVFPGNFSSDDRRNPFYAAEDKWIAGPLKRKGIEDPVFQRQIIMVLMDRLHDIQLELTRDFPNVHHIDVREAAPTVGEWNDEIHPNDTGFAKVGQIFRDRIDAVLSSHV